MKIRAAIYSTISYVVMEEDRIRNSSKMESEIEMLREMNRRIVPNDEVESTAVNAPDESIEVGGTGSERRYS